jgi:hypothetical protein
VQRLQWEFRHLSRRRFHLDRQGHEYGQEQGNGQNQANVRIVERRYGFRCRIRIVERQRCVLGRTCDAHGNKISPEETVADSSFGTTIYDTLKLFLRRQTGEGFSSDAPAECRTELVGCNSI